MRSPRGEHGKGARTRKRFEAGCIIITLLYPEFMEEWDWWGLMEAGWLEAQKLG